MELPFHLHPLELSRQFSVFFKNFVLDFDLRFPEGRKRRVIELTFETPDQSFPNEKGLEEFQKSPQQISLLDWPVLVEWNERWQQTRLRVLVHQAINDSDYREASSSSKLVRVILHRLAEISTAIRSKPLPKNPPLVELFKFRWKFSPLRDEAEYLIDRLKKSSRRN